MRMKRAAVIAGLLGVSAALTGCGAGFTEETDTVSYEVGDDVRALRVEADSGTIEVVESQRRGVQVTEQLVWRKNKPKTGHQVQGGTLVLSYECPAAVGFGAVATSCDVNYRVEVPRGLSVKVASDSGTLTLKGLSGALDALSDSGAIEAEGLAVRQVVAKTDSGDVELAFTGAPDRVTVSSDSGRVTIGVPQGAYDVVATTDSGAKDIKVDTDPSAPRRIELTSDSGDLEVRTP
ncbi:DUF4097 family beta strand repeat-containing protein [Nonomuraea rubra]